MMSSSTTGGSPSQVAARRARYTNPDPFHNLNYDNDYLEAEIKRKKLLEEFARMGGKPGETIASSGAKMQAGRWYDFPQARQNDSQLRVT